MLDPMDGLRANMAQAGASSFQIAKMKTILLRFARVTRRSYPELVQHTDTMIQARFSRDMAIASIKDFVRG